nr:sulfite exporter TauE/SafE family protein [Undibacterium griseum]
MGPTTGTGADGFLIGQQQTACMDLLATLLGAAIGLLMGVTGAGGGILAVPALVYSQGWSMQQAMPVALLAVTAGALIGAVEGFMKRLVRYRAAFVMALAGSLPTMLGVELAQRLPQAWLMGCFACVLLLVATRLALQLRNAHHEKHPDQVLAKINETTGRFDWSARTAAVIAAIGSIAGLMTGLLGVGGGFIIVPMLRHLTNVTLQGAVATSLFVISLVGSLGIASALWHGAGIPAGFSTYFTLATVVGTLLARRLAPHLPVRVVQMIFVLLVLGVAISLLIRAVQQWGH